MITQGMSTPRPCLICTAPTIYAHCGIDSCRSCSEFYKRTLIAGRIFVCRQGSGNCMINQNDRHNCRGCRFEKCKELGMTFVQLKSNELQPEKPTALISSKTTFLSRLSKEYLASVERRRNNEYTLRPTSLHRHVKVDFEGEDLMLSSWIFLMDCMKMFAGDHIRFASVVFPEFAALSLDDQRMMLKNFASRLYAVEVQCDTFRKFGSHDGPYYMTTLTTCFDSRNFKFFTEEENPEGCEEIARLMKHYSERGRQLYGPILAKSKFTDSEYAVLVALSIWQIDPNQCLPQHIVVLCDSVRRNIFDALKEYYTSVLNLDDYSVRLGNLITFEHTIQECNNLLEEEIQSYHLSGLLSADVPFLQSILQIPL